MTSPVRRLASTEVLPPLVPDGEPRPRRLGDYRLYERLGTGGQASVYRARRVGDPDARDLALKRLHPHLTDDPAAVQAFAREARLACLLDHPVIRRVLALGRAPGELFMIMEYVDGLPLNAVLQRARSAARRLPLHGVVTLLHRLSDALHHAHELVDERGEPAGLIHRDVSPSNLLITAGGRVKLIDLGVARSLAPEHVTSSGVIKGKYGYMAPEVLAGAPFDRRADVFSAGVVAWELLTTRKLFPVGNPPVDLEAVRARAVDAPSRWHPGCPPELDALVLRALAREPEARWPTCGALAAALHQLAGRLGEPLDDAAIAELLEVRAARDEAAAPARTRLARGTPAELPTSPTVLLRSPPPPARPRRARRHALAGAAAIAGLAALALLAPAAPAPAPPVLAPVVLAPPVVTITPAPAPAPAPPDDGGPREIDGSALTRLAGAEPRSGSSSAAYRARLCIDAHGAVVSVAVLDGPRRLEARIARALLRWRYRPYQGPTGPRPACFEVASRLVRTSRDGPRV